MPLGTDTQTDRQTDRHTHTHTHTHAHANIPTHEPKQFQETGARVQPCVPGLNIKILGITIKSNETSLSS